MSDKEKPTGQSAEHPADKPKIFGALAAIMAETKAISKSEKNNQQNFMFRGIDNVMNGLHDIFAKFGVFILDEVLDFQVTEKPTKSGSLLFYTRARIKFHFVADDGSEVTTINVGEAMDTGDKGFNKAMSIALKYSLLQMFLIPTAEEKDPDAVTPPETRPQTIAEVAASLDPIKEANLKQAIEAIVAATSKEALIGVWNAYSPTLHNNATFSQCMSARKKEIGL
jgi:hypothetical protein